MGIFDYRRIRSFRERLDLSQRKFAAALGVQQMTVYRWEKGRSVPNAEHLARMYQLAQERGMEVIFFGAVATQPSPSESISTPEGATHPSATWGTEDSGNKPWQRCLRYISKRMRESSFRTWLKSTTADYDGRGAISIRVPNQFVADWIETHYGELINEALAQTLGTEPDVSYTIVEQDQLERQLPLELDDSGSRRPRSNSKTFAPPNLNSRYSFESMVVGDFNQFACAASRAVAESPGATAYNPLLIYGGNGLGKTHLAQAIGHEIVERFPDKRVVYATSEKFTSDFISAISDRRISDFTRWYRQVDTLIIDDIQFFTGKESTQEQFFHTFNALYHEGRQIVLTADRSPKDIKGLEERLLSRFSSGLVTDLQPPDLESRMAILRRKVESELADDTLSDDVLAYIADLFRNSIRELEGALVRLLAYASLREAHIDLELAQTVLSDSIPQSSKAITIQAIQHTAAVDFNISPELMQAKKKTAIVAEARRVAMYLARALTDRSLKAIGEEFGGRDHSTVIHACNQVSERMSSDADFRERVDRISAALIHSTS